MLPKELDQVSGDGGWSMESICSLEFYVLTRAMSCTSSTCSMTVDFTRSNNIKAEHFSCYIINFFTQVNKIGEIKSNSNWFQRVAVVFNFEFLFALNVYNDVDSYLFWMLFQAQLFILLKNKFINLSVHLFNLFTRSKKQHLVAVFVQVSVSVPEKLL